MFSTASQAHESTLSVVGIGYPNADGSNRLFYLALLAPGEPLELRPDPRNKYDRFAVAAYTMQGGCIGYLSAERAPWVGAKIADGLEVRAIFQELREHFAVIRMRIGGGAPTMPPPRPDIPVEPDFYPDADGPEWGA